MATPLVTGAVALMLSANRSLTVSQIKQRLIAGSDVSTALNNRTVSDGELDVGDGAVIQGGGDVAAGDESLLDLGDGQGAVGGEHQGDGAGDQGRGHRGAAERAVAVAGERAEDAGAGGRDVDGDRAVVGKVREGAGGGRGGDGPRRCLSASISRRGDFGLVDPDVVVEVAAGVIGAR